MYLTLRLNSSSSKGIISYLYFETSAEKAINVEKVAGRYLAVNKRCGMKEIRRDS
jgi:hypothetical protein